MTARIDHAITHGTFSLDGGTWEVDNNIWVIGDDSECIVIDAPHSVETILSVVDGRTVTAILLTHAHDDHVDAAVELREATGAPLWLHPDDQPLWQLAHPDDQPDHELADGMEFEIAGVTLKTIHTPGHAPGGCCFYCPQLNALFSGDTLFQGGPGATGRSYSDRGTLEESIRTKLFSLPPDTIVKTGHGPGTAIGDEMEGSMHWD